MRTEPGFLGVASVCSCDASSGVQGQKDHEKARKFSHELLHPLHVAALFLEGRLLATPFQLASNVSARSGFGHCNYCQCLCISDRTDEGCIKTESVARCC